MPMGVTFWHRVCINKSVGEHGAPLLDPTSFSYHPHQPSVPGLMGVTFSSPLSCSSHLLPVSHTSKNHDLVSWQKLIWQYAHIWLFRKEMMIWVVCNNYLNLFEFLFFDLLARDLLYCQITSHLPPLSSRWLFHRSPGAFIFPSIVPHLTQPASLPYSERSSSSYDYSPQ